MNHPTVVYVHGIGNQPAPAILKRRWDRALFGIDMGARTRLAYWADIRYPQPLPSAQMAKLAVATAETKKRLSDAELIEQSKRLAPATPQAQAYAETIAKQMLAYEQVASRVQVKTVQAQFNLIPEATRRQITEWLTTTFIQDTAAYFYDPKQREKIRERLRQILIPDNGPYLVIGHSMGSIIAYDVLRELSDTRLQVPLLITIGSPLGIESVKD